MSFFQKLFRDFLYRPRHVFARNYLLLPIILLFAITGINVLGTLIVNRERNLRILNGKLINIRVNVASNPRGGDNYELLIFTSGSSQYYSIHTKRKKARYYEENLQIGDSLIFKTRDKSYKYFSVGQNEIMELTSNGKKLLSFKEFRDGQEISLLLVILSETFFIWLYLRHKRNKPTYV